MSSSYFVFSCKISLFYTILLKIFILKTRSFERQQTVSNLTVLEDNGYFTILQVYCHMTVKYVCMVSWQHLYITFTYLYSKFIGLWPGNMDIWSFNRIFRKWLNNRIIISLQHGSKKYIYEHFTLLWVSYHVTLKYISVVICLTVT